MDVAVIGTGHIGGVLGRSFARAGHGVTFGSRTPDDASVTGYSGAHVTDIASALRGAEVVVLAVPGTAVADIVRRYSDTLDGKLIVDATNNLSGRGPVHSRDIVKAAVPEARYARAFNSLGFENFENPFFGRTRADLFCSCEEADRSRLDQLVDAVGLRPIDVGGELDVIDGVARLWFALARTRGRHLAFKVLDDRDDTGE
jgi:8-hydroxy-5-deazaflavin:NADPH oxidoreductase